MKRALVVVAVVAVAAGIGALALVLKGGRTLPDQSGTEARAPRLKRVPRWPLVTASPATVNLRVLRALPDLIRERVDSQRPAWTFTGQESSDAEPDLQDIVDRRRTLEWETPAPLRLDVVLCTSDRAALDRYDLARLCIAGMPRRFYRTLGDAAVLYGGDEHCSIEGRVGPVYWNARGPAAAALQVSRHVADVVEEQGEQLAKADDD